MEVKRVIVKRTFGRLNGPGSEVQIILEPTAPNPKTPQTFESDIADAIVAGEAILDYYADELRRDIVEEAEADSAEVEG